MVKKFAFDLEILANVHKSKTARPIAQFALLSGKAEVTNHVNGKQHQLRPKKILVIGGEESKIDYEKILEMSDEEFKRLTNPDFKNDNVFPDLMKNIDPYQLSHASNKASLGRGRGRSTSDETFGQAGNWRKRLRELNKILKENNR